MITGKQLFSTLADGKLTVEILETQFPDPTGNQVLVQMEAAPINPSDLAILTSSADLENAEYSPGKFVANMPEPFFSAQKGRHGLQLPVGNEGAGMVIAAGEQAQGLIGQRVACVPGNAYSQYCIADAGMCLPLGDISSQDGASAFVNPMTALGFAETARMENQKAIIHLAAASNLGQMLVKICLEDNLPLVNIVRRAEHVDLLKDLGAEHVVNSSADDFMDQLRGAIDATDAYCGLTLSAVAATSTLALKRWNKLPRIRWRNSLAMARPRRKRCTSMGGWILHPQCLRRPTVSAGPFQVGCSRHFSRPLAWIPWRVCASVCSTA